MSKPYNETTQSRQKYRHMASATRRAANRYFKRSMRNVDINDNEMVKMYKRDLKDLRNFARLVNNGQLAKASAAIDRMDTAVYEEIPNRTYNYVRDIAYKRWIVR